MRRIALLLLVLIAGCTGLADKERAMQLDDLMRGYTRSMEWSDFQRAMFYRKYTANQPPPDLKPYQDIKISDYRPSSPVTGKDGKTVVRTVQIRYIQLARMSEQGLTTQEVWEYSEADGRWYLISELPKFSR